MPISRELINQAVLLPLAICVACVGCGKSSNDSIALPSEDHGSTANVVATVGMVAELVRNVGGEHVQVTQICGSGVDPHLYKPTRDDVQTIMGADVVFYCGLMLEGKMADVLKKISSNKPVFAVTEAIDKATLFQPPEFEGHYDPHVWNDVSAWAECVTIVEQELAKFDPKHAEDYAANAKQYRAEFTKLHEYGVKVLGSIPEKSRVLITSHDAFNYFGRAYGLDVLGVQGLSTESEAGIQRINELVDLLVEKSVKAVFVESSVSRKNIDALVEGAKSRGHDVVVGGELFSDAMGATGTYEGTYLGMLDHNISTTARALGGDVPPGGFQGKLSGSEHSGSEGGGADSSVQENAVQENAVQEKVAS